MREMKRMTDAKQGSRKARKFLDWNISIFVKFTKIVNISKEENDSFKEMRISDLAYLRLADFSTAIFPFISLLPIGFLVGFVFPTPFAWVTWPLIATSIFYTLCTSRFSIMISRIESGKNIKDFNDSDIRKYIIFSSILAIVFIIFVKIGLTS